jgi:hypothetical protein
MPVAIELVRDAYRSEGKLEDLDVDEQLPYLSSEQFAWAGGVIGMAARLRPAANIMIGPFWAESMMFAETFDRIGAMQVGGTARMYQIPFFAALCDYQIGSIASQDWYKIAALILIIVGALLATANITVISDLLTK